MIRVGYMPGATESPLEERFATAFDTYRADDIQSVCQADAPTPYGPFRLDVLLTSSWGRRVAVELDGAAYHDAAKDILRDAAILHADHVKRVIRISGHYLFRHREHTMYLLSQMEPWCISKRGHQVLKSQMRAAGDPDPWLSADASHTQVYISAPEPDEADPDAEPRWGELAVLTDHTLDNPLIKRALFLMRALPDHTLAELRPLLLEPT